MDAPFSLFYRGFSLRPQGMREEPFPFADMHQIEDLEPFFSHVGWDIEKLKDWKEDIRALLHREQANPEQLNALLAKLVKANIQSDIQATFNFLVDILELETLHALAAFKTQDSQTPYTDIFAWAAERSPLYPQGLNNSIPDRFYSEWKKYRPMVLYFIPNLINIFLGAFNFLDSNKKFTTLWEKHLLLDIVYKFFLIPFCLIQMLQPLALMTAKVYVAAALIIVGVGILIAAYQKWLKPLPDEIVNCTNLDKQMENGVITPKVGQTRELNQLFSALLTGSNVLLIGKSGDGKTTLAHHLIQLKKEGKLPQELQELANYEIDCGLLISSVSYGHSELINQIKDQVDGYENKTLFLLDEFEQIVQNQGAFLAFKKRFLEDQPSPRFIATTTFKEFEKIKEIDADGSFRRRVVTIVVDGDAEEQNRLVLYELINRIARHIPITEDAVEAVLECSLSNTYLPTIGRPAKVIKIMKEAIGRSQWVYNSNYTLPALSQAKQELKLLKAKMARHLLANGEDQDRYRTLRERIGTLQAEENNLKQQVGAIKTIIERELTFKEHYFKLTHQLAATRPVEPEPMETESEPYLPIASHAPLSLEDQKLYLLYHFYGLEAFQEVLEEKLRDIEDKVPVRINRQVVKRVFEEIEAIENKVFEEEESPACSTAATVASPLVAETESLLSVEAEESSSVEGEGEEGAEATGGEHSN